MGRSCHKSTALAGLFALALTTPQAAAHPTISASAMLKIDAKGDVTVLLSIDAIAFALDDTPRNVSDAAMLELLAAPDESLTDSLAEARDRFSALFELLADGRRIDVEIVEFPTTIAVREWVKANPGPRLPVRLGIEVRAQPPAGTNAVAVRFPDVLGETILTVDRPVEEAFTIPLNPGETSPPFDLRPATTQPSTAAARTGHRPSQPMTWFEVALRYVALGFTHIVPEGTDHALFVLGLFLLSPRFKTVLWQITAFTIAHTVTLTLTALHIIGMPARVVEPAIAMSIAFIGVENLLTTRVHPWRPAVAFLFGLVHGMGVASSFVEAGFPEGQLVPSLAAFTVGVEGGHMAVLAAAFLALGWCRNKPWYRKRVAIPLSLIISVMALYWTIRRLSGS